MKRVSYYLYLALSEFHVHRKRFNLTALSIAWGTCSILVLLAFGQGMRDNLDNTIKRLGDNVIFVLGRRTSIPFKGMRTRRRIEFDESDVSLLRTAIPTLKYVGGTYNSWGMKAIAGKTEADIEVTGVDPGYCKSRFLEPEEGSRFISPRDMIEKRRVIFVGKKAVEKFYDPRNAVGETVLINDIPFVIIGVMKEKELSLGFGSDANERTYIPATTYKTLFGNVYYSRIIVSLPDKVDAEEYKTKIREVLGIKHSFHPDDKSAVRMWDTMRMMNRLSTVMRGFQILLGCVGAITLMISGVGLANIMYASIKRRTREIGIKIAIGAQPSQIQKQILVETFLFGIAGGIAGGIMAFVIIEVFSSFTVDNHMLKFFMNARLSTDVWIASAIVLLCITFIAGYFPARAASRQNPITSLRYE